MVLINFFVRLERKSFSKTSGPPPLREICDVQHFAPVQIMTDKGDEVLLVLVPNQGTVCAVDSSA